MNWLHRHRWKVNGAHMMNRVIHHPDIGQLECPVTEILLVCGCGQVRTQALDGHWTLDQLRPSNARTDADQEFFRRMGVKL